MTARESFGPPQSLPSDGERHDITVLLAAWRTGDRQALDQVMGIAYRQLHSLASSYMSRERQGHTLSATALVHEAYLRLMSADLELVDRAHFLAVAATTMRRILIDRARSLRSARRGSGAIKLTLAVLDNAEMLRGESDSIEVLYLDQALNRLHEQDERKARLMEMIYFGGLNCEEAAIVLAVSVATVNRELKLAKAWLKHSLARMEESDLESPTEADASAPPGGGQSAS